MTDDEMIASFGSTFGTGTPAPCQRPRRTLMKALGVIPARYASTRFPGKPLHLIAGKPMVEWVHSAAKKCHDLEHVVVATDDKRIFDAVKAFGGEAVMTRDDHVSGFDRIVEVAEKYPGYTHYVNVQGDEPLLPAPNIAGALTMFQRGRRYCNDRCALQNRS